MNLYNKSLCSKTDSNRMDEPNEDDLDLREGWPDLSGIISRKLSKACSIEGLKSKLPVTRWLRNYQASYLLQDIVAGLSVGLTAIPQGKVHKVFECRLLKCLRTRYRIWSCRRSSSAVWAILQFYGGIYLCNLWKLQRHNSRTYSNHCADD